MNEKPYDGRIHIYVRKEDQDKWEAIPDKPKWLHDNINRHEAYLIGMDVIELDETLDAIFKERDPDSTKANQMYSQEVIDTTINNLKIRMRERLAYLTDHVEDFEQ